ncbi:MAG: tetrahydromethanopterin S-methyltransferase subunit A [Methanosphaera sp.]|uniref:tetrahydromethanopterin S-methyltransferase subunit A n=1 Tax=Methanosphaera sp. TaxID=2666342 RepID=UPI0025D7F790|nr:tetrahydromethanopterin S-methyltransferase subunit A [Methanosphaera sp.]MCI5866999.1 tetrahydromethanopterin S-methyltransferase subunit A [Methanosphaera sp.]MDD6533942.1 tetrahydromethanopterin S-methyltransferase subunit A [Methanosphaera sp.]MDY3956248.1 tetrahydromethanopterin S-methyltransferase subunit A [Methanosphaera sp.]
MVDKKQAAENWPRETGDYDSADSESCVAVVSLGSKMNEPLLDAGAAIAGPLHTENLGIEKMVANVVANPNIRYVIVCGSEVQGHITGQTITALYENGIEPDTKSIIGSKGAIPFVENLTEESIARFQDQIELVDMIDNENLDEIQQKIKDCIANDPGAYHEEAMIVKLNEKPEDETDDNITDNDIQTVTTTSAMVDETSVKINEIQNHIKVLDMQIKNTTTYKNQESGYDIGKIEGIVIGFILALIILVLI